MTVKIPEKKLDQLIKRLEKIRSELAGLIKAK